MRWHGHKNNNNQPMIVCYLDDDDDDHLDAPLPLSSPAVCRRMGWRDCDVRRQCKKRRRCGKKMGSVARPQRTMGGAADKEKTKTQQSNEDGRGSDRDGDCEGGGGRRIVGEEED